MEIQIYNKISMEYTDYLFIIKLWNNKKPLFSAVITTTVAPKGALQI